MEADFLAKYGLLESTEEPPSQTFEQKWGLESSSAELPREKTMAQQVFSALGFRALGGDAEGITTEEMKKFQAYQQYGPSVMKEGVYEGLTKAEEGVKQLGLTTGVLLKIPGFSEERLQQYSEEVAQRRREYEESPLAATEAGKVGEFVGQTLPYMIIPGSIGSTVPRKVLSGALVGGAMGGTAFVNPDDPDASRAQNVIIGTALGTVLNFAPETHRLHKRWMQTKLNNAYKSKLTERVATKGEKISEATGFPLTAYQETGDPFIGTLEATVKQSAKGAAEWQAARNAQVQAAHKKLSSQLDKIGTKQDTATLGAEIKQSYTAVADSLQRMRSDMWKKTIGEAKAFVGNKKVFPVQNTRSYFEQKIDFLKKAPGEEEQRAAGQLARVYERLLPKRDESGRLIESGLLDIDQFQSALHHFTKKAEGKGRLFVDILDSNLDRAVSAEVKSALLKDMELAENGFAGKGADLLKLARRQYAINSGRIQELQETTIGKMLNTKTVHDISDYYDKLVKMKPTMLRQTVEVINGYDSTLMNNIRRRMFEDTLEKSMQILPDSPAAAPFDPKTFMKNLPDNWGTLIADKALKKEMVGTIKGIKRLSYTPGGGSTVSEMAQVADVGGLAGGAIQGGMPDFVFVGRYLPKYIAPKFFSKVLMDPAARKAIRELQDPLIKPNKASAAVQVLWGMIDAEVAPEEQE